MALLGGGDLLLVELHVPAWRDEYMRLAVIWLIGLIIIEIYHRTNIIKIISLGPGPPAFSFRRRNWPRWCRSAAASRPGCSC